MSLQTQAAALWKWGRLYPNAFPDALRQASEVYMQDRIERNVVDWDDLPKEEQDRRWAAWNDFIESDVRTPPHIVKKLLNR